LAKKLSVTQDLTELKDGQMRQTGSGDAEMRKSEKCANPVEITFFCELIGNDIKTLNSSVGKGSYMLKVGQRTVRLPYTSKGKKTTKNVTVSLYKFKGLKGLLRRAAEALLLKLKAEGKAGLGPCAPAASYPHEETLDEHKKRGYHEQGSCNPMCMVRRLYGSMYTTASIKVRPPYIAKATLENLPVEISQYLDECIGVIFGIDHGVTFHNGESTLKVETFNIINRVTEQAVNNFMKHSASGTFPFKVVFNWNSGTLQEFQENIGFFIASLHEINKENGIQIGADKNNGSGQVKICVTQAKLNNNIPELKPFVKAEEDRAHCIEFCGQKIENSIKEFILDPKFGEQVINAFNATIGN
jgi:CRISPR/Cas system CSM-associated protein Csm3 (group 7 of RAMP superfamily)